MQMKHLKKTILVLLCLDIRQSQVKAASQLEDVKINEEILFLGNFDAVSLYDSTDKYNLSTINQNNSLSVYELSDSNGTVSVLHGEDLPGIPTLWQSIDDTSSIMVIDGQPHIYNLENSSLLQLKGWDDVDGDVKAVYYDYDEQIIYFGGSLSFNNTYGALQYDYESEQLLSLPFGGFDKNSTVNSIISYDHTDSIIFGGKFSSIGFSDLLNVTHNVTEHNYTIIRNSSGIIDISQKIPIRAQDVSATAGENYNGIICPSMGGNGWQLPDYQTGSWSAVLQSQISPSKIRLYNSNSDTNGVKTFRVVTYPANGIMNMTYVDPTDLKVKYCDAFCPLSLQSSLKSSLSNANVTGDEYYTFTNNNQTVLKLTDTSQDFAFANSIDVTSFTVEIVEYYGSYAELMGIELYSLGITAYANNTLNQEDSCSVTTDYDINVNSEPLGNLQWNQSPVSNYLYANVLSSNISSEQGIRYNIYLPVSGKYSVLMYTTGCLEDNSCANRGIVNATLYDGLGMPLSSHIIYQTNQYEKYDVLYTGVLTLEAANLPVYIDMVFYSAVGTSETTYFVADSVQFDYIQLELKDITGNISREYQAQKSDLININGLLEYVPSNFSDDIEYPIGNSSVNLIGNMVSSNATINALIINETSLLIAGDFESVYGGGILGSRINESSNYTDQIELSGFFSIEGGTDGKVTSLYGPTEEFVMIGDFDNFKNLSKTSSLSLQGSVVYDSYNNSVRTLNITNSDKVNQLSGFVFNDTEYLILNYNDSSLAPSIYDFTSNEAFENTSTLMMNIFSSLDSANADWQFGNDSDKSYVLGSIVMFDMASNNIAQIKNSELSPVNTSRDSEFVSGVYVGDGETVIGGSNLYRLSNGSSSILTENLHLDDDAAITSLLWYKSNLLFAFNSTSMFHAQTINGLAIYDMENDTIKTLNESFTGHISDMTVDPEFGNIIGVGDFSVGNCNAVCTFGNNSNSLTINRTVSNLSGSISSANYYSSYKVLLGGNFTAEEKQAYMGYYDTSNNTVLTLDHFSSQLPDPVQKFIFGDERKTNKTLNDVIVVMGADYIGFFNDSKWTSLSGGLDLMNAEFTDIALLDGSSSDTTFYNTQILLLSGRFNVTNYGLVSSAIWNGQMWLPYTIFANDLDVNKAIAKSVVKMTTMFIYDGPFTSTSSSSTSSSTHSPSMTAHPPLRKNTSEFTNGQVTGVGCALAVGTLMLLSGAGMLYLMLTSNGEEKLEGLKLTGED